MRGWVRTWRTTPREKLLAAHSLAPRLAILLLLPWVLGYDAARAVVTGRPTPAGAAGLTAALQGLGWLALAVPTTWLMVVHVRRPVARPPDEEPPPGAGERVPAGDAARADAERTAWRTRGP